MHDPGIDARLRWYAQAVLARTDDGLAATELRVNRWIDNARPPFFWFINIIECHSPYLPPRPYNSLGPIGRLGAARDARRYQTLEGVWGACARGAPPPAPSLRRMRTLYHRAIRMMDDWIARLCETLDAKRLLDETLLVVTSDHGENFGEGNLFGHAVSLDDRLLRVPLVFAGPGAPPDPGGVTTLASLPRLLAGAVGLDEHPWEADGSNGGVAVAQYDVSPSPDDPRLELIRSWGATEDGFRRFAYPCTGATDGRYKLVVLGSDERLYDVERDPEEVSPLRPADGPPEIVETLRRALQNAARSEWTPDVDALRATQPPSREPSEAEVKELEDRMRLLGYL
jgi:arylsulfatase A-like enzyme